MKGKSNKTLALALCIIFGMFVFTGCSSDSSDEITDTTEEATVPEDIITIKDSDTDTDASDAIIINLNGDSVECSDNSVNISDCVITLTKEGNYLVTGTLNDGQIIVDAGDNDKVHIILDNSDIHCEYSAPVYVKNADKAIITLNEGTENVLSDGSSYTYDDEEAAEPDAVIFSKDDLSINGEGSLLVTANFNNGITCKDDLKIVGGTINITSTGNGIKGRDSLTIAGGNITGKCEGKGLLSNNDEDESKGYIHITDGTIALDCTDDAIHSNNSIYFEGGNATLTTDDDGIHADNNLNISGGTIVVSESYEGLEATNICIDGGDISVTTSDDGINAADSSSTDTSGTFGNFGGGRGGNTGGSTNCSLIINGGSVYVNAGGDGLDSNGYINMTGGTIVVDGPTNSGNGSLDYGSYFTVSGGYLAIAGSSGMLQSISAESTQCGALISVANASAGSPVTFADEDGNVIISYTPAKSYNTLIISTPDIKTGTTYYVYQNGTLTGASQIGKDCYTGGTISGGDELLNYEQSSTVSGSSNAGGGFGGGNHGDFGGGRGNFNGDELDGNMKDFGGDMKEFDGEKPDNPGSAPSDETSDIL